MKKFEKAIIYMLVALFVAVSTVLVDFNTSYALSSYNDVPDADWKYFIAGNTANTALNKGERDTPSLPLPDGRPTDFVSVTNCQYVENLAYYNVKSNYCTGENVTISSDAEIVLVLDYVHAIPGHQAGTLNLFALSKSRMYFAKKGNWYWQGAWQDHGNAGKIDFTTNTYADSDYQYLEILSASTTSSSEALEYAFMTGKMKVFSTADDAMNYLETGDISNMSWQGGKENITYDKDVHFDSFNMDVHASNSLDNYYIDFRYSLPNNLVGKGYSLRIDSTYRREVSNVLTGDPYSSKEYTDYQYVTLSDNPFSCRVYLKNFNSVILGLADKNKSTEPFYNYYGVLSYYDSVYLGLTSMADVAKVGYKVSMSLLNISCKLEKSGSRGFSYNGSLDILTGANDIGSYTPDSNGTYKPNNDYRQNGYYYTEVSTDAAENTTYNYYYITNDNSRTEITKDENDNNSKSGEGVGNNSSSSTSGNITNNNSPVFTNNNNITVEGDSINNEVNNIVDSSSSAEDNKNFIEKFLGFFQLLENNSFLGVWGKVFGWLPPGISSVITTALGISAGIGIFRFFRR